MPILFRSIAVIAAAVIYAAACQAATGNHPTAISENHRSDVIELSFADFFQMPIGAKGLQPTEKLQQLRGKTVRIVGYMVHEENPTPGIFMLASHAVNLSDIEDGPADDLPATAITAHLSGSDAQQIIPYRPGPWELTGKLDLGNAEESSGRVSYVRLILDQLPPTKPAP